MYEGLYEYIWFDLIWGAPLPSPLGSPFGAPLLSLPRLCSSVAQSSQQQNDPVITLSIWSIFPSLPSFSTNFCLTLSNSITLSVPVKGKPPSLCHNIPSPLIYRDLQGSCRRVWNAWFFVHTHSKITQTHTGVEKQRKPVSTDYDFIFYPYEQGNSYLH